MGIIVWFTVAFLLINGGYSYILLTANMEDVQNVLKQLANSHVIKHFQRVWNRAANKFKQELNKPIRRQSWNGTKAQVKPLNDVSGVTMLHRQRASLMTGRRALKGTHGTSTNILHSLLI